MTILRSPSSSAAWAGPRPVAGRAAPAAGRAVAAAGVDCVGFGSDFDGIERWPEGLHNPVGFPVILERLEKMGYTGAQVAGIAGLNLYRVLRGARQAPKAV